MSTWKRLKKWKPVKRTIQGNPESSQKVNNPSQLSLTTRYRTIMYHVINWQEAKVLCKECNARSRHIREAIWIRKRAPNTMNRDEGAHFLSHLYDPLLTSSATVRTPSTGRHRREKLDYQLWWSTLSESVRNCQRKSAYWCCHMKLHLFKLYIKNKGFIFSLQSQTCAQFSISVTLQPNRFAWNKFKGGHSH